MSGRVPGVTTTPTMRDVIALSWPLAMNALFLQAILIVDTVLVTPLGEASLAAMGLAASLASVVSGVLFAFYLSVLVAGLCLLMILGFQWLYPDLQAETRGYLRQFLPVMLLLPAIRSSNTICGNLLRAGGDVGYSMNIPVGAQWFVNWREENHASAGCSISRFRQGPTPD